MTPAEYAAKPWQQSSLHSAYESSFLHMRPAPEYASGEVLLASTYRRLSSSGATAQVVTEGKTPANGREFQKHLDRGERPKGAVSTTGIEPEVWRRVVTGTLRSPKQRNQTAKRFLQISPVVPDAALYSLSARLSANSWNAGSLVERMIQFGSTTTSAAQELWNLLFHALSVDESDDIWARFLNEEFTSWRPKTLTSWWSKPSAIEDHGASTLWHRDPIPIPADRFVDDLGRIVSLKGHLTRRQWISMVESILRIGAASHVLWVCKANSECLRLIRRVLDTGTAPSRPEVEGAFGVADGFWRYGQAAKTTITDYATDYIKARAGINLFLHLVGEAYPSRADCLSNVSAVVSLLEWLAAHPGAVDASVFRSHYQQIIESDQRIVSGQKGIASNIAEFIRHSIGQRQTAEPGLDSYDQGYFLAKKGSYLSAPWVVSLGPVAVLTIVHACTHNSHGPRTVEDLCKHLGEYGIEVRAPEVPSSPLGQTLRNLGLVLDSPDAEGGMVVINPFEHVAKKDA